jgi:thiol-disulfide isomerase/thioredoxin
MVKFYFLIIVSFILLAGCKTVKKETEIINSKYEVTIGEPVVIDQPETDFSEQSTWLLGYFTKSRLTSSPHSEWFIKGYDSYNPDNDVINQLNAIPKDILTIKIVLGTWCPDSRREVPRFMRIIDLWQYPAEKITFIGVDNAKLSPVGEYESLNIERVPTFIIYKNNIEAGRIIENPKTSLEQDIVNILKNE